MIRLLAVVAATSALAASPRKIRGVRADRWTFDVLTRRKGEDRAEIVAVDKRGEVGWFEVLRAKASGVAKPLHARLRGEPDVDRGFGRDIMVEPEARRRGVAEAMVAAAEDVVRGWDLSELVLTAVKSHEPSYSLYRKMGFEEVPAELAKDSESVMLRKFVPTPTRTD
mmetsp:Transcript_20749/g.65259  ORF Transcript_20749/g.65259 Transcript_20749/m.65259 type:complete len:168 (-) Transcript_20749:67-570(-)